MDTFTSAIDFASIYDKMKIKHIEWQEPTTVGHTAVVNVGGASGIPIFDETCIVANQSQIKYYAQGEWFEPIYIAASGVQSGKVMIVLE